jgi:cysteinyl-tRNA synthetase
LQAHYRSKLNFTWEGLQAAQTGLEKILETIKTWDQTTKPIIELVEKFNQAINDDLNTSKALAVLQEVIKADYPTGAKRATIIEFDKTFGLQLDQAATN